VIHGGIMEDKCEKTQMLILNDRLIDSALFQEQQILIDKLKLRLFHDHRDLCRAKQQLELVRKNERIPEPDHHQKARVRTLRNALEHERWRIALLNSENADLHISATMIQKTWRGFAYRKHNPTLPDAPVRIAEPLSADELGAVPASVPKIEIKTAIPHMDKVDSSDEYYSYAESDSQAEESAPSSGAAAGDASPERGEEEVAGEDEVAPEEEEEIVEEEEEDGEAAGDDSLFEVTGVAQPDGGDGDSDDDLDQLAGDDATNADE
jgi:hypothetical protein